MERVLIIEDDELIAELERDYLEANGYETALAFDGITGEQKAKTEKYDAILLDVMLPGKTGFDVCRELRKSLRLPIIMVTAKKEDIDKIRGLGLGADDYLVKPFSPTELACKPHHRHRRRSGERRRHRSYKSCGQGSPSWKRSKQTACQGRRRFRNGNYRRTVRV